MEPLLLAIAVFLGTHLIPGIRPLRQALIDIFGERLYLSLFSLASLGVMVWLFVVYLDAPYVEIWPYSPAVRTTVLLLMPVSCFLVVAGLTTSNPFSLSARGETFDPSRPGIVRLSRHPAFWGMALWSGLHVAVNGDVASLLLFGLLTALGAFGPVIFNMRKKRLLGDAAWTAMDQAVRQVPFSVAIRQIGWMRGVGAVGFYLLLLFIHGPLIGPALIGT